ncbi:MAG TPA: transcription-repair coupling factor [Nitrospirales bacterium]|nr:transcription-repair coupling factor [Nitrospirales bacterium]
MSAPTIPADWSAVVSPLLDAIEERRRSTALVGLFGAAKGLVISALARRLADRKMSVLVVTPTDEAAERLQADVAFFNRLQGAAPGDVLSFPDWGVLPYASTPPVEVIGQRMRVLDRLRGADRGLALIVPVTAFLQRLLPRSLFTEACFSLKQADTIERAHLVARLLRLGYRQVSVVENPGEFAVRGGIVDLFSTAHEEPRRLEFLGDTIETIRLFDPATQKSSGRAPSLRVLPARELIRQEEDAATPFSPDAEWRGPSVYPAMDTLLDYFAAPPVLIADEPAALRKHVEDFQEEARAAYGGLGPSTPSLPPPEELFLPLPHLLEAGGSRCLVTIAAIPPGETDGVSGEGAPVLHFEAHRPQAVGIGVKGRSFTETLTHLETLRAQGPVVIVARSRGQVDRLKALFLEHDLPAEPLGDKPGTTLGAHAPYALVQGELSGGLLGLRGPRGGSAPLALSIIVEDELFAKSGRHKAPSLSKSAAFLKSLEEVKVGDYVVHVQHGIGRYLGLRRLSVQGFDSDYLIVEYAGGDMVYVPLDRLNQIQRYSPSEGHTPKLSHLGGTAWSRTKTRVRESIEEMAKDLIAVHAARQARGRSAFSPDDLLSHEFDAAFEYEETADQLRSTEDVRRDMESDKPMDRLICGDVGYGKTEVAMRAAFKAVQDNKQVAVLVPTTLLAQQHFETFTERFAPFPVTVGVVSRLQPVKDQKATLRGFVEGSIDIAIGTHRLLQKDVQFRNLGLVVIDEEQWFGVRHKERLKQLRNQVDVLTLTATPIPRTLQMALSGLRDLSVIETPPPDRLAIRTQVVRFGKSIIREAILRELGRGGQVFFVHNRVQDIERMGAWLKDLVPEARIVVAHGQMDPRLLEATMVKFHRREADVLLCTTIIESGLDIPNANTILVNRADTFGLAQLYQLRGRVGRSAHQAYAYFLIAEEDTLTGDAQKRLQAIQEFTELGSGFRIAAADLEIRGGGNLLGKEQSGHIDAVGFELYMQMLEQAVHELKGEPVPEEFEPNLQLQVSAYIPEEYVGDVAQRLALYKRLTAGAQMGDLAQLHGELVDRYGVPPEPVERLFEVMEIRLLAKALCVAAIQVRPTAVAFSFGEEALPPQASLRTLMDQYRTRLRFTTPYSFELLGVDSVWKTAFPEIKRALQVLTTYDKNRLLPSESE